MTDARKSSTKAAPGRPFVKGDPRRYKGKTGRPPAPKCIPDLLRWSGQLLAPDAVVAKAKSVFGVTGELTIDQATILMVRLSALKGDMKAIEFWADRTEGKALQTVDVNVPEGPLFTILPHSTKA